MPALIFFAHSLETRPWSKAKNYGCLYLDANLAKIKDA